MALLLQSNWRLCALRGIVRSSVGSTWTTKKHFSSSSENSNTPKIAVSKDGSVIACWYPEPTFPYEHSRPLPRREPEMREGDSALKVQHRLDYQNRYQPDGPTNQELMKMFNTSIHQWRPIPRKRFPSLSKPPKRDREGI